MTGPATGCPKVSVAILTYNQVDIVGQAIDSALMQETTFDFEIRIGDDFSTDGTRDVLEEYRRRYPDRIFLNLQPRRHEGLFGRQNNLTNLRSCRGEYIAMLDGDDWWTDPHKLQSQVALLDGDPNLSAAAHDAQIVDRDGRIVIGQRFSDLVAPVHGKPQLVNITDVLLLPPIQTSTLMFRRELLFPLPAWIDHVPAGDWGIFAILAMRGPIRIWPRCLSVYRRHRAGVMAQLTEAGMLAETAWQHESMRTIAMHFPQARTNRWHARELRMRMDIAYLQRDLPSIARSLAVLAVRHPAQVLPFVHRYAKYLGRTARRTIAGRGRRESADRAVVASVADSYPASIDGTDGD